ncbi:hypothetical protein ACA369_00010 [Enterobacter kobei]|uniref:hypothetical protein n=1 Tax=Enterobacter kobei TaxID=208224 RepID=UPI003BA3832F
MGKMTFVFEYEDGKEPPVSAGMEFMGGKIVAAAFVMLSKSQKYVMRLCPTLNGWKKASAGYDATDSQL